LEKSHPGPRQARVLLDGDWGLGFGEMRHLLLIAVVRRAGVELGGDAVLQRPGATRGSATETEVSGRAAVKQFPRRCALCHSLTTSSMGCVGGCVG
jgi:hypothetical protein